MTNDILTQWLLISYLAAIVFNLYGFFLDAIGQGGISREEMWMAACFCLLPAVNVLIALFTLLLLAVLLWRHLHGKVLVWRYLRTAARLDKLAAK